MDTTHVRADSTARAKQLQLMLPSVERRIAEEAGSGVVEQLIILGPVALLKKTHVASRSIPGFTDSLVAGRSVVIGSSERSSNGETTMQQTTPTDQYLVDSEEPGHVDMTNSDNVKKEHQWMWCPASFDVY